MSIFIIYCNFYFMPGCDVSYEFKLWRSLLFCYDLGSQCCLTINNLSKQIIWIQNIHQVDLTKSNLLKWTTLILKSVWNFQRSQRGKRGFVIHFVCFTFSYLSNMYWLYSYHLWPSIWLLHAKDHEIFVMSEVPK